MPHVASCSGARCSRCRCGALTPLLQVIIMALRRSVAPSLFPFPSWKGFPPLPLPSPPLHATHTFFTTRSMLPIRRRTINTPSPPPALFARRSSWVASGAAWRPLAWNSPPSQVKGIEEQLGRLLFWHSLYVLLIGANWHRGAPLFLCIIRPSSPRREEKGTNKRPRKNGARVKAIDSDIITASKRAGKLLAAPDLLTRSQLECVVVGRFVYVIKAEQFQCWCIKKKCLRFFCECTLNCHFLTFFCCCCCCCYYQENFKTCTVKAIRTRATQVTSWWATWTTPTWTMAPSRRPCPERSVPTLCVLFNSRDVVMWNAVGGTMNLRTSWSEPILVLVEQNNNKEKSSALCFVWRG